MANLALLQEFAADLGFRGLLVVGSIGVTEDMLRKDSIIVLPQQDDVSLVSMPFESTWWYGRIKREDGLLITGKLAPPETEEQNVIHGAVIVVSVPSGRSYVVYGKTPPEAVMMLIPETLREVLDSRSAMPWQPE